MTGITRKLAIGAASAAMMVGLSAPALAASSEIDGNNNSNTQVESTDNSTDNSNNADRGGVVANVDGDCSGVIVSEVEQNSNQSNGGGNLGGNLGGAVLGENSQETNQDTTQSNSSNQDSSIVFDPDCSSSVTNVTNVEQVAATPKGGVKAGLGGGAETSAMPLLGFGGSLSSLAYGAVRLLRRS